MSLYEVNKLMRRIANDDAAKAQWGRDPWVLLREHDLTDTEADALWMCDYAWLYGAGVHPHLLRRFVGAARQHEPGIPTETYSATVGVHGRPDFRT